MSEFDEYIVHGELEQKEKVMLGRRILAFRLYFGRNCRTKRDIANNPQITQT